MIKIGLNGFGRVGRVLTRLISSQKNMKLVAINEIDTDVNNLAYLLKYDSIYGKFKGKVPSANGYIFINGEKIKTFSKKKIQNVPWKNLKIDVLVDATGVGRNVVAAKKIAKKGVSKVIITHSPDKNIDFTMIMGVNEKQYNPQEHHVVSSSICDASALGPLIFEIEKKWKIENGFITTLHSRLPYQNLLDGSLKSVSSPGHSWKDYSLGRNSMASLIPKKTTAVKAVTKCIPSLRGKLSGISFRVPTSIVCGSDLTLQVKNNVSLEQIKNLFKNLSRKKSKIYEYQEEALVSIDHLATSKSLIIDSNYIEVLNSKLIKMVIWYDNEWGYSNRVIDIINFVKSKK